MVRENIVLHGDDDNHSGDLDDLRVRALLAHHVASARGATAPGSDHALDVEGLKTDDILFWTAWEGDCLVGVGALKALSNDHGEIKSMHTDASFRRRGVGSADPEGCFKRCCLKTGRLDGADRDDYSR